MVSYLHMVIGLVCHFCLTVCSSANAALFVTSQALWLSMEQQSFHFYRFLSDVNENNLAQAEKNKSGVIPGLWTQRKLRKNVLKL